MAARRMASPIHTFTGAFTDADYYDERVGSRSVANSIGAIPHEVEIRPADYVETIEKVIWHLDEPTLGTGAFPQYMVSRMAADHVKVVLTGHGGDELFAGYQVNKVALIKEALQGNPLSLFQVLLRIRWDEWTRVAYYLLYPLLYPEVRHGLFIMTPEKERASLFAGDFLSRVASHDLFMGVDRLVRDKDYSPGEKLLVLYLKTYLPTLFIQEDKMGMAHSIEARMPICDNRLVDLALRLPFRLKLWGGRLKSVPREAMRPWLPRTLYRLPKRGFPTPFARWYRCDPVRSLMEDLLYSQKTAERGIFNTKRVRLLFERNLRSKTDTLADYALANRLYSMSMVELWFRLFMDGGSSNELALR
jgi:asparagine synthase (glutamine-hydrolysing)